MTHPFNFTDKSISILMDGTVGFLHGENEITYDDAPQEPKKVKVIRILPLDHQQKPGNRVDNPIIEDFPFSVEILFGSNESIDAFIETLEELKNSTIHD